LAKEIQTNKSSKNPDHTLQSRLDEKLLQSTPPRHGGKLSADAVRFAIRTKSLKEN
jgi:hypothetical protein